MASVAFKLDSSSIPHTDNVVSSWLHGSLEFTLAAPGMEEEVLSALAIPTLTNVIMAGFIRDNGLIGSQNRGRFYVCRNEQHKLEGVALIGHSILFHAFNDEAIDGFASLARRGASSHLLMGEHAKVQRFWSLYADQAQEPRHVCPVLFLRRDEQFDVDELAGLRPHDRDLGIGKPLWCSGIRRGRDDLN